jgi:hypothetical protein
MEKNYRGDTFFRNYSVVIDGEKHIFKENEKIKVAFCRYDNKRFLEKEIIANVGTDEINIVWNADEMRTLEIGDYILEAEVTTQDFVKTNQEKIKIDLDFIYGEDND